MTLPISTAELAERFHKGETVSYLAEQYLCSPGTILYRLNQSGARSRTRAKINARALLVAHRPVLLGLLAQLERSLEVVREQFAARSHDREQRKKFVAKIEKLEEQIFAIQSLTSRP